METQHTHRYCKHCEQIKEVNPQNFHKNHRIKSGYNLSICKICANKGRMQRERDKTNYNCPMYCKNPSCHQRFFVPIYWKRIGKKVYCSKKCCPVPSHKGCSWNGKRKGINNPNYKYSIEKVIEIKKLLKEGKRTVDISRIVGFSQSYISNIKNCNRWSHVVV